MSFNNKIRVQMGDICCSIACDDEEIYSQLREQYVNFLSDEPADISINLEIVDGHSFAEIEKVLPRMVTIWLGTRFVTIPLTLECEYDEVNRCVSMKVEKHLFDPTLEYKLMNRIMPAVYYSVRGARNGDKPQAMLVHSCGILRHGQALVFAGPSGTGKTTVARFCGDEYGSVINDEMVFISRPDNNHEPTVQGAPIIGEVPQRLNVNARLACVILLKQSARTAFRRLDRLEAYLGFIRQVIAPTNLLPKIDERKLLSLTTGFGDEIARDTVFYELEFNLDRERFWEVIEELEKSMEEEVLAR